MSQYFTFDGTTFHNKDAFKTLKVKDNDKRINDKLYFFITVIDNDGCIIFETDDYKISEGNINTPTGYEMYEKIRIKIINAISSI